MIPTGIRVEIDPGWWLGIFPRSGLGFKYKLQLSNTIPVFDSDYFNADNEGHILIKLFNDNREGKTASLDAGTAFAQGIFMPYGIASNQSESTKTRRTGGLGSTGI